MSQYIMLRHGCFCKDAYSAERMRSTRERQVLFFLRFLSEEMKLSDEIKQDVPKHKRDDSAGKSRLEHIILLDQSR
ncbi:Uncharacterised protein [Prevotella denticola]|uniref:Uncharacterized protein n=1 Tax=Prevotella denticola TaxID=28129 RepID=A0A379E469_9BACT|nr:Uncharacterised protein [Prevotella denticola]